MGLLLWLLIGGSIGLFFLVLSILIWGAGVVFRVAVWTAGQIFILGIRLLGLLVRGCRRLVWCIRDVMNKHLWGSDNSVNIDT